MPARRSARNENPEIFHGTRWVFATWPLRNWMRTVVDQRSTTVTITPHAGGHLSHIDPSLTEGTSRASVRTEEPTMPSSPKPSHALPFLAFAVLALMASIYAGCLNSADDTDSSHDEVYGCYGCYGYYGYCGR